MHFAPSDKQKSFKCSTCPESTMKARRCMGDSWKNQGSPFPIQIMPNGNNYQFCPAKVQRDAPELCLKLQHFWLSWKLGHVPNAPSIAMMDDEDAEILSTIIYLWEKISRDRDYQVLAKLIGGK